MDGDRIAELVAGAFSVVVVLFGGFAYLLAQFTALRDRVEERGRRLAEEQNRLRHDNATRVHLVIDDLEERLTRRIERLEDGKPGRGPGAR